jgi:hypothetical protein
MKALTSDLPGTATIEAVQASAILAIVAAFASAIIPIVVHFDAMPDRYVTCDYI